jgi:osmotically-inducible protein OsmY
MLFSSGTAKEAKMAHDEIVERVVAALERDPTVNLHHYPLNVRLESGALVMEGETESVAAKKIALETAAAIPGVPSIVDRLHVVPAMRMEDGAILDRVCDALVQEQPLDPYSIQVVRKGRVEPLREPPNAAGYIEVEVTDGIVTLNGRVGSLSQMRLAGVMAWWVAGTRDVVNGLEVAPAEEDDDGEVVDAVRLVLEEDPFVNASQIRVGCRDYIVTLDGLVRNEQEKKAAENDAWYVFRVDKVVNRLSVQE